LLKFSAYNETTDLNLVPQGSIALLRRCRQCENNHDDWHNLIRAFKSLFLTFGVTHRARPAVTWEMAFPSARMAGAI
jgi:hypothetical protein